MKLVVGNFKMKLNYEEVVCYNDYLQTHQPKSFDVILCPSFPYLPLLKNVTLGSQDVSTYETGAYTGEVSAIQLKSLQVNYAIVGHSERRIHFLEDNNTIAKKIKQLQQCDITPILCIGETLEEKRQGVTDQVLQRQLKEVLQDSNLYLIVAYEPIWAIGSGITPSIEEISLQMEHIQNDLHALGFDHIPILYGGSVDENNIEEILKIDSLSGVLVGSYSTKWKEFLDKLCQIGG